MFKIPSHKNSTNARRESRANGAADAKTPAENRTIKMQRLATAILSLGCIAAGGDGFTVTMAGGREFHIEAQASGMLICDCFDFADYKECCHQAAARTYAEKIMAEESAAADLDGEFETPSKGFVNVTERKVIEAVERVAGQEFAAQVRKTDTGKYEVYSCASGNTYRVELNRGIFGVTAHCDCPDFTNRRLPADEVCKHISAVYQFERCPKIVHLNDFSKPAAITQEDCGCRFNRDDKFTEYCDRHQAEVAEYEYEDEMSERWAA